MRIFCPGTNYVMGVMASVEGNLLNAFPVFDLFPNAEGQVDNSLALIFGRMLLRVRFKDSPFGFTIVRERYLIKRIRAT